MHHINKERGGYPTVKCSKKVINKSLTVNEFVAKLLKNYTAKNPTQGTFHDNQEVYPFQKMVNDYLADSDFLKFTTDAMAILEKEIAIPTAIGGYVVFLHYVEKKVDFIITAMLDESAQFAVADGDLDIEKLMTLDLEKMARANRLNIARWKNSDDLYLSFIKGTRDVSKYFLDFIGSTDITSARENFKKLKDSISMYYKEKGVSREKKEKSQEAISVYIDRCFKENNDVEIESIASLLNNENPKDYLEFLQERELEVSGRIGINRRADFENFMRNRVKEDGYSLVFDKALIKSKKIVRDGNNIIIKNVAEKILTTAFEEESNNSENAE